MTPTELLVVGTALLAVLLPIQAGADDLPRAVDLRPRFAELGLPAKSQAPRGCCSLFAFTGVLEYELAWSRPGQPVRLSEEFLNWASHQTNGRRTDGSFFSDAMRGLATFGVCEESLMPYAATFDADASPSAQALADAATRKGTRGEWIKQWDVTTGMTEEMLGQIKRSLAEGHPVAIGMRWPKREQYDDTNLLQMPPEGEVFDGHSIILVGYTDDPTRPDAGTFIFRNHAGPQWREAGCARLPYAYVRLYGNDALGLRVD